MPSPKFVHYSINEEMNFYNLNNYIFYLAKLLKLYLHMIAKNFYMTRRSTPKRKA